MAIDLMVMPLTQYWAGDYVTPAMRSVWESGVPYAIVRPGEPMQQLPAGVPFGGRDAASRSRELVEVVRGLQAQLGCRWQEEPRTDHWFNRVDSTAFGVLRQAAEKRDRRPSGLSKLFGAKEAFLHLAHATIFVPCRLEHLSSGDGFIVGSAPVAEAELAAQRWPSEATSAAEAILIGLGESRRRRLPLVIDM